MNTRGLSLERAKNEVRPDAGMAERGPIPVPRPSGLLLERSWVFEILYAVLVVGAAALALSLVGRRSGWPISQAFNDQFIIVSLYAAHFRHLDLFPVWSSSDGLGLGTPVLLYYQKTFFYVAGVLLILLGGAMKPALVISTGLFMVIGAYGMRLALGLLTKSRMLIVVGSIGILFTNYAFTDWLPRGDLPEFSAMMIVPWLLYWCLNLVKRGRVSLLLIVVVPALVDAHSAIGLVSIVHHGGGGCDLPRPLGVERPPCRMATTGDRRGGGHRPPRSDTDGRAAHGSQLRPRLQGHPRRLDLPGLRPIRFLLRQRHLSLAGERSGPRPPDRLRHLDPPGRRSIGPRCDPSDHRADHGGRHLRRHIDVPSVAFLAIAAVIYLVLQLHATAPIYRLLSPLKAIDFAYRMLTFIIPIGILLVVLGADVLFRRFPRSTTLRLASVAWLASLVLLSPLTSTWTTTYGLLAGPDQFPSLALSKPPARIDFASYGGYFSFGGWLFLEYLPKVYLPGGDELYNDGPLYTRLHRHQDDASLTSVPCTLTPPGSVPLESLSLTFRVTCAKPTLVALPVTYNGFSSVYVRDARGNLHPIPYRHLPTDPRMVVAVHERTTEVVVHLPTLWGVLSR